MAIELIAPMTRKGAPPLGAESPPELRQHQQTPFRALVRKLMRPKADQARQVARPEIAARSGMTIVPKMRDESGLGSDPASSFASKRFLTSIAASFCLRAKACARGGR